MLLKQPMSWLPESAVLVAAQFILLLWGSGLRTNLNLPSSRGPAAEGSMASQKASTASLASTGASCTPVVPTLESSRSSCRSTSLGSKPPGSRLENIFVLLIRFSRIYLISAYLITSFTMTSGTTTITNVKYYYLYYCCYQNCVLAATSLLLKLIIRPSGSLSSLEFLARPICQEHGFQI